LLRAVSRNLCIEIARLGAFPKYTEAEEIRKKSGKFSGARSA
jgi:hypothetical protein